MILRRTLPGMLLMVLTATCGFGDNVAGKPACDAKSLSKFWPDAANSDSRTLFDLSRTGQLELCTRGTFRYKWRALTVSYQEIRATEKSKAQSRDKKADQASATSE
jgi:hypothetical protein